MRLGDSDIVRIALIPSQEGYTVTAEFTEHQTVTSTVNMRRPSGYDLSAVARLDGDRLSISLLLRWTPAEGVGSIRESIIFSRSLNVMVNALLGMTTAQATSTGLVGLALGGGLSALALASRRRAQRPVVQSHAPNPDLVIEPQPGLHIQPDEAALLRTLFRRYARLVIENEFRSGYSGARTLLALPVRADGRADAYTIAKIGSRDAIQREFENYETFVKDTLPPITARIQEPPVTVSPPGQRIILSLSKDNSLTQKHINRAVLRYTFIGEPGHNPISLREALLANPDPACCQRTTCWSQQRVRGRRSMQARQREI
jgi:hypothetical protein